MSLFFPLVFLIVCSLNFTNISENIYGLWELCLQGEKLNHDERWFILNVLKLILFWCLSDIVPSVKQCASKRNSSRVNSAYMDSTIKEYIKEYYRFLRITPMNLDKPMRYHRNTTEASRHPMINITEQLTGQSWTLIFHFSVLVFKVATKNIIRCREHSVDLLWELFHIYCGKFKIIVYKDFFFFEIIATSSI